MVTQLGYEKLLQGAIRGRGKTVFAPIWRRYVRMFIVGAPNLITLHPRTEVALRHVILDFTRPHAVSATDAAVNVDAHRPKMVARVVAAPRFRRNFGSPRLPFDRRSKNQQLEALR